MPSIALVQTANPGFDFRVLDHALAVYIGKSVPREAMALFF